jgi:hypothetical protein
VIEIEEDDRDRRPSHQDATSRGAS